MQADTVHHTGVVDPEIVEEVARLTGYPAESVAESVKARVQDKVRASYCGTARVEGRLEVHVLPETEVYEGGEFWNRLGDRKAGNLQSKECWEILHCSGLWSPFHLGREGS
jgi:hypothetical protein